MTTVLSLTDYFATYPDMFRRIATSAPLHFLLGGVLMFALMPPDRVEQSARSPVVIDDARIAAIAASWAAATGREPSEQELDRLVDREVDEEILFQEALRYGVHLTDPVIRQRMLLNMRFIYPQDDRDDDTLFEEALKLDLQHNDTVVRRRMVQVVELSIESDARSRAISDEDRETMFNQRLDEFVQPARARIEHAYFSRDRRSDALADASAALNAAATSDDSASVIEAGDAFLGGHRLPSYNAQQLDGQFGRGFGEQVLGCEPQTWCGPIESAYGFHLVKVIEKEVERQLAISDADVVKRLDADISRERAEQAMAAALAELRVKYGLES